VEDKLRVDITDAEFEELPGQSLGKLQLLAIVPPTICRSVKVKSVQLPLPHKTK
jgi:hypothetical protein